MAVMSLRDWDGHMRLCPHEEGNCLTLPQAGGRELEGAAELVGTHALQTGIWTHSRTLPLPLASLPFAGAFPLSFPADQRIKG